MLAILYISIWMPDVWLCSFCENVIMQTLIINAYVSMYVQMLNEPFFKWQTCKSFFSFSSSLLNYDRFPFSKPKATDLDLSCHTDKWVFPEKKCNISLIISVTRSSLSPRAAHRKACNVNIFVVFQFYGWFSLLTLALEEFVAIQLC